MTPARLAVTLGITDKKLRRFLRSRFPRRATETGSLWDLGPHHVVAAQARFSAMSPTGPKSPPIVQSAPRNKPNVSSATPNSPTISLPQAIASLGSAKGAIPGGQAAAEVDDKPGLYAIFVDTPKSLPQLFQSILENRKARLLYVGRAKNSLKTRLVEQELRHKRAATFFRGIGAILNFRPQRGSLRGRANQKNYRFSKADTAQIIAWIDAHLSVRWLPMWVTDLMLLEPQIIRTLKPLMNKTHNPEPCQELSALRKVCRDIACA